MIIFNVLSIRNTCLFMAFCIYIFSYFAIAEDQGRNGEDSFFSTVKVIVKKNYPTVERTEFARGDLDGDGVDDVAAMIYFSKDGNNLLKIAVYKGGKDGKYSMISQSQPFESNDRRTDNIGIKKGSLFFSVGGSSYTDYWGESYQFRWQSNKFIMIGNDSSRGIIGGECNERTSVNYLTNKVVVFSCAGKKQTINNHDLKQSKRIFLDEFSF